MKGSFSIDDVLDHIVVRDQLKAHHFIWRRLTPPGRGVRERSCRLAPNSIFTIMRPLVHK